MNGKIITVDGMISDKSQAAACAPDRQPIRSENRQSTPTMTTPSINPPSGAADFHASDCPFEITTVKACRS